MSKVTALIGIISVGIAILLMAAGGLLCLQEGHDAVIDLGVAVFFTAIGFVCLAMLSLVTLVIMMICRSS
jgi:hypothetical protein